MKKILFLFLLIPALCHTSCIFFPGYTEAGEPGDWEKGTYNDYNLYLFFYDDSTGENLLPKQIKGSEIDYKFYVSYVLLGDTVLLERWLDVKHVEGRGTALYSYISWSFEDDNLWPDKLTFYLNYIDLFKESRSRYAKKIYHTFKTTWEANSKLSSDKFFYYRKQSCTSAISNDTIFTDVKQIGDSIFFKMRKPVSDETNDTDVNPFPDWW